MEQPTITMGDKDPPRKRRKRKKILAKPLGTSTKKKKKAKSNTFNADIQVLVNGRRIDDLEYLTIKGRIKVLKIILNHTLEHVFGLSW